MASNVVVTRKVDGSLIPKKETPTSPHKIDGIDALLMATSGLITAPEQEKSFWEN
jgi:phage terminase large subunit-like protein